MRTRIVLAICLSLLLLSAGGCTTTHVWSGSDAAGIATEVRLGDEAQIRLTDGSEVAFVVTEITPETIRGAGISVRFEDIESMRAERDNPGATAILITAMIGLAVAIGEVIEFSEAFGDAVSGSN